MEWILKSPQIHSTFGNLGYSNADGYHINEKCNEALANILHNLLTEDKYLRTYRRNISFGQNVQKDIIPLLIHAKEDKTIELLISILVNLTIPIECLLSVNVIGRTNFGSHTIFEINNLLAATKEAFTDQRVTKVVVEFLKKHLDFEKPVTLTPEQCTNTSNGLLLLRNILHIPEDETAAGAHAKQNQILWNIFSQSIDKVLITLMTIPEASNWSVAMVQLVALMYKDQHAATLHKLLNFWLESSQSESSEDNESNTSPPDRGSEDSSLMLTSDPTSDSSNTSEENIGWGLTDDAQVANASQPPQPTCQPSATNQPPSTQPPPQPPPALPPPPPPPTPTLPLTPAVPADRPKPAPKNAKSPGSPTTESNATKRKLSDSKSSSGIEDCTSGSSSPKQFITNDNKNKESMASQTSGYGTQIEHQETISTSSNEDEPPKPVHQKPHHPKQKPNTKIRISGTVSERKKKKIIKRSKGTIINVQGLSRKTPTDEDIAHVLKEFTVDFLLKGYNALVQTLHNQILTDPNLEIDTSHFFWLVTYFLKFATQIELGLEHVSSVLSFDIAAFLAAEGVNLCEEFELVKKIHGGDLKPNTRRLHLVVTAIREFVQAIEVYQKQSLYSNENRDTFQQLQIKLCELEELRLLMVLLLKHYNPRYHNKQYLQDLIITNHFLLLFVDNILRQPNYKGKTNMVDQIKLFATPEMMYQYALLLEDYKENGEFVNDCIFTLMHHVGGELESLIALYQPKILKIFTAIWKTEFEICDDWTDLIEYVINTFIKRPNSLLSTRSVYLDTESFDDESFLPPSAAENTRRGDGANKPDNHPSTDKWTDSELSSLSWNFLQCNMDKDMVGQIVKLFKEDGVVKSRESVIKQLYKQNLISKVDLDSMLKDESDTTSKARQQTKDVRNNDIAKLCEQLIQDGKSKFLEWIQKVLLDTCFAKIYLEKKAAETPVSQLKFECFKKKHVDLPQISPVAYHCLLKNNSVPLVPWNFDQATVCKDLKFLQLVHKLGFHMPVDTGKLFIRIPHFWTADILYDVAGKIMPIDTSKLKFKLKNDLSVGTSVLTQSQTNTFTLSADVMHEDVTLTSSSENYYRIHKQDHHATMVNFTPMPGISFEEGVIGSTEAIKRNWLEVVQRSQELKITLQVKNEVKIKSETLVVSGEPGARPFVLPRQPPPLCALSGAAALPAHPAPLPLAHAELAPRDDDEAMPALEDEDNSVCETASVASDLTRMYVSDEDEKLELLLPIMEVEPSLLAIDDGVTSDSDTFNAIKRSRVTF